MQVDLSVELGSVKLSNPVMTASGTCGYGLELSDFVDLRGIGGFVTKSITIEPRQGNKPQRTVETACGMLNAIGLANVGLAAFCKQKVNALETLGIPVFVNVAGRTIEEYVEVARRVSNLAVVSGVELNISCPNVKAGGIAFGTDPALISDLVGRVRRACPDTTLIVKLTPNVTDIAVTARAAVEAGADVLSLINTLTGLAVDIEQRRAVLGNRTGGLSGPAIKPVAICMVDRVYRQVAKDANIPIVGMGGISSPEDALEFIIAGATAVAVGTAAMIKPVCLLEIRDGIAQYLHRHKISSISQLVGTLDGAN